MSEAQGYDLIGDIHGCAHTLEKLLTKLDYQCSDGVFYHVKRKAIFLGDVVDRGPRIKEALRIVKAMVDAGHAEMVLGNHEYNALAYFTESDSGQSQTYLRAHTARNHRLLKETMEQFAQDKEEWQGYLAWFKELPLFIEKEHFRVVHACWDASLIDEFCRLSDFPALGETWLHESASIGSFAHRLVDRLTRGTALALPNGETIVSKDGYVRSMFRTRFWGQSGQTYGDVAFQPDPLPEHLFNRVLTVDEKAKLIQYADHEKPVFVGHYWMAGEPAPIACNVACLDYSAVKYGKLVAYRMDAERQIDASKFVWVDVNKEDNE